MTDFVINRPDPGSPEWTMWSQDLATPPTLGQTLREGAMETTGALQRFLEEAPYAPGIGGTLGRGMIAGGLAEGGAPPENVAAALQPQPDPVKRPAAEINEQAGGHVTDQPMGTHLSDLLIDAKRQEIERENIWSRWANAHTGLWGKAENLAVGTTAFLADPLNAATLFMPGIGEEAILARLGAGIVGRTIAGGVSTALGATAAQLPLTALKYGIGQQEGSDYDLRAAFSDLAMNAVGGAALGAGFGALGHVLRAHGIEAPVGEEGAELVPQAARVLDMNAVAQHAATGVSVSSIADGRPVDVEPFVSREITPAEVVERQRQLFRDGYAPGVPQEEMRSANQALTDYMANPPKAEAPEKVPEGWATGQAEKAEEGVPEVGRHAMPELDPELADAEQRFARQPRVEAMLPEEQEELARTQEALGKAQSMEQALQAAAECLKDTGI